MDPFLVLVQRGYLYQNGVEFRHKVIGAGLNLFWGHLHYLSGDLRTFPLLSDTRASAPIAERAIFHNFIPTWENLSTSINLWNIAAGSLHSDLLYLARVRLYGSCLSRVQRRVVVELCLSVVYQNVSLKLSPILQVSVKLVPSYKIFTSKLYAGSISPSSLGYRMIDHIFWDKADSVFMLWQQSI